MDEGYRPRRARRSGATRSSIRACVLLAAIALALLTVWGSLAQGRTGSLTTIFDSNNGQDGNTFDLSVLNRRGIVVESLDVNVQDEGASTGVLGVYTRPGTADGFEQTLDGWNLRDTAKITAEGTDQRTPAPVSFSLPKGDYGVAVGLLGASPGVGMLYTDGVDTFANDDLRLTTGVGLGAPLLEGSFNDERIWNGTIYYSIPSCEFAKKKLKKAKKQVRKAKRALADAKASGDPAKIARAEKKLEKKLKKRKKAKRVKRRACG
jgi:hypothetical protein